MKGTHTLGPAARDSPPRTHSPWLGWGPGSEARSRGVYLSPDLLSMGPQPGTILTRDFAVEGEPLIGVEPGGIHDKEVLRYNAWKRKVRIHPTLIQEPNPARPWVENSQLKPFLRALSCRFWRLEWVLERGGD
jgi:hypothetical protein